MSAAFAVCPVAWASDVRVCRCSSLGAAAADGPSGAQAPVRLAARGLVHASTRAGTGCRRSAAESAFLGSRAAFAAAPSRPARFVAQAPPRFDAVASAVQEKQQPAADSSRRVLHTMLRVGNLERSIQFYTEIIGMKLLRQKDYPDGQFTLAFLGFGPEEEGNTALELTYNYGVNKYDIGAGYGHIALSTENIYKTCDAIRAAGGKVTREPGPMKHGTTVIAFVEDPDGYKIELIEKKNPQPFLHTMLRVGDLERSVKFYTDILGMKLLRSKDYPSGKFTLTFVGYGPEETHSALELTHNWDTSSYDLGTGFGHVALATSDIRAACDAIRAAGGKVIREPGPMKHGTTVIAFVEDPDGYKVELIEVQNGKFDI